MLVFCQVLVNKFPDQASCALCPLLGSGKEGQLPVLFVPDGIKHAREINPISLGQARLVNMVILCYTSFYILLSCLYTSTPR